MLIALAKLSQEGFKNLCSRLRDNSGGYLSAAVSMANEFLPDKKLIVYTPGTQVSSPRLSQRMARVLIRRYHW